MADRVTTLTVKLWCSWNCASSVLKGAGEDLNVSQLSFSSVAVSKNGTADRH